jgi:Na+-translocating ferredoxin:NAD+ oxidoreductase subunit B
MALSAILVLTAMGLALGFMLGVAAKVFHVDSDPLLNEISALMPGTHCGQCGYAGCSQAAEAMLKGDVSLTCCPPGGKQLAETVADKLGISIDLGSMNDEVLLARINPAICTGCTRCYKACPTDAIIGANKQLHAVIMAACTGCKKCAMACPEKCIEMVPESRALESWQWPKPIAA